MKLLALLLLLPWAVSAQPVARTTVVEHFTNTYCSICAGRNPGFYANLAAFPDVLHIAYYPSAPYPACPFNQLNKAENDARTNYYGVFGSTPRLVINGMPISANEHYYDPIIFQREAGQSADYALRITVSRLSADSGQAIISIRKVASNSAGNLRLFAVVTEDTVQFNANNGETVHYDLFHKSLTGIMPQALSGPITVGDSLRLRYTFAVSGAWGATRVTAILQDSAHHGLQAARSAVLPLSMGVPPESMNVLMLFPNPADDEVFISGLPPGYYNYAITDMVGRRAMSGVVLSATPISLRSLPAGTYVFTLLDSGGMTRRIFTKR